MTRMLDNKNIFQAKAMHHRKSEFDRRRADREERIAQIVGACKQDRETKRKLIFVVRTEEERINKLREEEEALKREEAERRKTEEAERKAKLDETAEKQRQRERELEEKERLRREALLRSADGPLARPLEISSALRAALLAANAAPATGGKYVPRFKRAEPTGPPALSSQPPSDGDRWGEPDDRNPPPVDKWRSGAASKSTWSSSTPRDR